MASIKDLARDLQAELDEHEAKVTAAKTQLNALQQAHSDILAQATKAQKDLGETNQSVSDARVQATQIVKDAQVRAGAIISEADKMSREASAELAAAEEQAKSIRQAARDEGAKIIASLTNKHTELQDAVNELNRVKSQSEELRRQARQFADGC